MSVVIIGSGEVAKAAAVKFKQLNPDVRLLVVSRNVSTLSDVASTVLRKTSKEIIPVLLDPYRSQSDFIDVLKSAEVTKVINLGSPYLNLVIMDACLEAGCHYLDTACYEALNTKGFSYKEQLSYQEAFQKKELIALFGAGGSPGLTNVMAASLHTLMGGRIDELSIFDGGSTSRSQYRFATNFSPEDNIKELDNPAKFWRCNFWEEEPAFSTKIHDDLRGVDYYRIYHEELETLIRKFGGTIKSASNYMSFGEDYLNCFNVLKDIGLFSMDPVYVDGHGVIPIRLLSKLLPHPSKLAPITKGLCFMDVVARNHTIKNSCYSEKVLRYSWEFDCEECYEDTGTGAVAWSTGVPAIMFSDAMDLMEPGVYTPEDLPVDEVLISLPKYNIFVDFKATQYDKTSS